VDCYPVFKRVLDILFSFIAFLCFSPLFYFIILLIQLDSPGAAFFRQHRVGRNGRSFRLLKFRSMVPSKELVHPDFDPGNSKRVTQVGRILRHTKLDELPGLFNVINGDMSIVGPRPEVAKYVDYYSQDFKEILKIRPGLSDYASIKYRDEEDILAAQSDPEDYYVHVLLPDKLRLAKRYIREVSLSTDFHIVRETLRSIFLR